jgi:hypothetical protein
MHEYEIRVLSAGHTVIIIEETYLSDHAAVRSGRKFAGERCFEVWRGLDCIYETPDAARASRAGGYPPHP